MGTGCRHSLMVSFVFRVLVTVERRLFFQKQNKIPAIKKTNRKPPNADPTTNARFPRSPFGWTGEFVSDRNAKEVVVVARSWVLLETAVVKVVEVPLIIVATVLVKTSVSVRILVVVIITGGPVGLGGVVLSSGTSTLVEVCE